MNIDVDQFQPIALVKTFRAHMADVQAQLTTDTTLTAEQRQFRSGVLCGLSLAIAEVASLAQGRFEPKRTD